MERNLQCNAININKLSAPCLLDYYFGTQRSIMDMNRKKRLGLKNKKMQRAASLMLKFVMVLALCVMMMTTAHAGAFLYNDGTAIPTTELSISNLDTIENNSKVDIDKWENWRAGGINDPGVYSNKDGSPIKYSGVYLGTFGGNDGLTGGNVNLEELIQSFLGTGYHIEAYGKYDYDEQKYEDQSGYESLHFNLFETDENKDAEIVGGNWKITDESETYLPNEKINFYSIKSSQKFALYYVDPAASTGTWTTAHVLDDNSVTVNDLKEISHFTVMRTNDITGGTSAVPEPATMLLFGLSLMGLAGMARRKNSKF
jgi:hypothetical protein